MPAVTPLTTFSSMPDPTFYDFVSQHPDGSWTASPKSLDDTTVTDPMFGNSVHLGVKSILKKKVEDFGNKQIAQIALPAVQIAANTTIAQLSAIPPGSLTPAQSSQLSAAQALTNKIQATNNYAHQEMIHIDSLMTFDACMAWVMPTGWPSVV